MTREPQRSPDCGLFRQKQDTVERFFRIRAIAIPHRGSVHTKRVFQGTRRQCCAGSLSALAFLLTCWGGAASAQDEPAPAQAINSRPVRPLILNEARYRLRAGERVRIDAQPETLDFMRTAKTSTVTINGTQTRGFAVGPSMGGDEVLLAASLTMKAGEYAVTVSALDESGEERAAVANITVDALPVVPPGGSTPPVVLLNGWQFSVFPPSSCPISTGSSKTFGSLQTQLIAPVVYFFDNCVEQAVNGSTIEELGVTLGQFLNMVQYAGGALVPQVDLVSHSMGGLIVRSYLAGLQPNGSLSSVLNPRVRKFIEIATPNFGSFLAANYSALLANGTQAAEMIPGSAFLWSLATWNQRGDDVRGVDALAIIGNAGYWKSSIVSTQFSGLSDGVVSLTSASLNFARDPSRTRILPYCHIDVASSGASSAIDCTGKGGIADVDQAPETGVIVLSFLAGTSTWQSIGFSNQTQYGGGYFALENAAGTQYTSFSSVSLGSQAFEAGAANTIFYNEFVSGGTGTFKATSAANQTTTCGPFTATGGYFSVFRCKFSPVVSSVGPLLPNVAGWVVKSGSSITINGVGFGQQCSGCQVVAYPGPIALQVSSWSDSAIAALLPSMFNGIAEVVVQAASGSDSMTFMASPPPVPPTITLSNTQLQFTYTMGGVSPAAQSVTVTNSGGGTLTWSAIPNVPWLTVFSSSNGLTVSVSPSGLSTGAHAGTVTVSASGVSNSPATISVTLTVNAAPASPVVVSAVVNAASWTGGAVAPGELLVIGGAMLGPSTGVSGTVDPSTGKMVSQLAGTTVLFDGIAAPLLYTSATQVNAIVPYEVAGCTQTMLQVRYQGVLSSGTTLPCATAAPGVFTFNASGAGPSAAANQDGTFNGPSSSAAKGSYVTLYFTGGGQTNPAGVTGSITGTSTLKWLTQGASVTVGGVAATVAFDGAAPTFVDGVLQLNIQLSGSTPSGNALPVVIKVGSAFSPATATLAVQ